MSSFILVNALFCLLGGALFGAIGWLINGAAATARSSSLRAATAAVTSLLPLILLLALGTGPALGYGLAAHDPKAPLLIQAMALLVFPAALGSALGARTAGQGAGRPQTPWTGAGAKKPGSGAPRLS